MNARLLTFRIQYNPLIETPPSKEENTSAASNSFKSDHSNALEAELNFASQISRANIEPEIKRNNLYHFLKKRLYKAEELDRILSNLDDDEKYLGTLPKSWVKQFKDGETTVKTREIQRAMSKFSASAAEINEQFVDMTTKLEQMKDMADNGEKDEEIRELVDKMSDYINTAPDIRYKDPIETLKRELEEILRSPCKVEYESKGGYGNVFKIEALGEKLAIKAYSKTDNFNFKPGEAGHGQMIEVANAIHLNSSMKKAQCSKFYCAKITQDGEAGGFLLTSFVEKKEGEGPAKELTEREKWFTGGGRIPRRYSFGDTKRMKIGQNVIDGKLVDYGDVRYTCYSRKRYETEKYFYRLDHPPKAKQTG